MRLLAVTLMVTALWLVLGAVLHGGRAPARDVASEPWWWEACRRTPSPGQREALPPSHPLARLGRLPSRSSG